MKNLVLLVIDYLVIIVLFVNCSVLTSDNWLFVNASFSTLFYLTYSSS